MPLPGGFAEVFEYLASVGVRGFEFFQSTQNANEFDPPRQPTAAEIRQYLDAAGLKAVGTHQFGLGNLDPATGNLTAAGEALFEFLSTLGMDTMGFSGNLSQIPNNSPDPANPGMNLPNASGWLEDYVNPVTGARTFGFRSRAAHANRIGEILRSRGVKYFYHPEQDNYRYFNDPAHPELDTVHRIQWVMDNTDPQAVRMGDRHPAQLVGPRPLPERDHSPARHQRVGARAGRRTAGCWAGTSRTASGTPRRPGPGSAARRRAAARPTSRRSRARRRSPTRSCRARATWARGPAPTHPNADPDCPGFKFMFENLGGPQRLYLIESDSGPGPTTGPNADPGRSLRHAKASAAALLSLRK